MNLFIFDKTKNLNVIMKKSFFVFFNSYILVIAMIAVGKIPSLRKSIVINAPVEKFGKHKFYKQKAVNSWSLDYDKNMKQTYSGF